MKQGETSDVRVKETMWLGTAALAMMVASEAHATQAHDAPPVRATHHDDDDDDDDDGHPLQSGEIVVTARKLDSARASVSGSLGASTYALSNDAIEKRPSGEAANLVNVLMQMPGVTQGGDSAIRVRGQIHVQYRINNIILPEGLSDPADTLRARFADRIELVTGALPAQYGLQTGGVVNITTKNGVYEHGGEVELYGGTQGRFEPAFELAGSSGNTNYYVSGSYLHSDAGLPPADRNAIPLHDRTDQGDGLAYVDHIIDSTSRVALIVGVSGDALQTPHPRGLVADGLTSEAWGGEQRKGSQYGMLSYQRSEDGLTLQVAGFLNHASRRLEPDLAGDLAFNGIARQYLTNALSSGLQTEAVYALGQQHHLRAGLLATWRQTKTDAVETVLALAPTTGTLALTGQFSAQRLETGVYLEDEWKPLDGLTLNYGLRFDRVTGQGGGNAVGPRANLVWEPIQGTTLHAGYARYFVPAPQRDDAIDPSRFAGTSGALPTQSDDPARAEKDDYVDIGISQKLEDLTLGVDAYWRRATNLLDEAWTSDGLLARSFNYARGHGRGVEFSATWSEGPISAWGNLAVSWLDGRGIVSGQSPFTASQIAWAASHDIAAASDQRLSGSAGLTWHSGPLRLSTDATYGSGLPRSSSSVVLDDARMPAWVQLNLAAVYRVKGLRQRPLDLRVDLTNALDTARRVQDGSSLAEGMALWGGRRGVFVGLEQTF